MCEIPAETDNTEEQTHQPATGQEHLQGRPRRAQDDRLIAGAIGAW